MMPRLFLLSAVRFRTLWTVDCTTTAPSTRLSATTLDVITLTDSGLSASNRRVRNAFHRYYFSYCCINTHVIIIIVWLARCWTLPFLRSCSRLDDSALNDTQDQYWVVRQIGANGPEQGVTRRPDRRLRSLGKWTTLALRARLWSTDKLTEELKDDVCKWRAVSTSLL